MFRQLTAAIVEAGRAANLDGFIHFVHYHPARGWSHTPLEHPPAFYQGDWIECPPGPTCTVVYHDGDRRIRQYPVEM